jgi:Domain of unknown function (DUF4350)
MTIIVSSLRSRPHRLWWAVAGLLVIVCILLAAPKSYPGGSSYDSSHGGYSQWYAFMKQQGHSIQRWRKNYSQLSGQGQVLIQISDQSARTGAELQSPEVLEWVKQGNTLIGLGWTGKVTGAPFRSDLSTPQGPVRIETSRRHRLEQAELEKVVSTLQDEFGSVIWSRPLGRGQVIEGTYPWVAANIYAGKGGNFRALEALSRPQGPIWMDEWLHGYRDVSGPNPVKREQSLWRYLSHQPLMVTAGQSAVLLLLLVWGKNQRFGPLMRRTGPLHNSSEQYIQALATTLQANGNTEYVLLMIAQSFRQRLQTRLGLGGNSAAISDAEIAQHWASETGRSSQELLELLQVQPKNHLSESALLRWVQQSEAILQDLRL